MAAAGIDPSYYATNGVFKPLIERTITMPKTKLQIIKPFLAVISLPDGDVLHRLISTHDGVFNNPTLFTNTPFDGPTYKSVIDRFASAAAAAAQDGGKAALEERNKSRREAIMMYRILGHYVEIACKNDMNTFVSSGFTAVTKPQKTAPQPLPAPESPSLEQGQPGEIIVTFKKVPKALHYQVSHVPVPASGPSVNPTTVFVTSTKPPTVIKNLTPGTTYAFQVRAFGKLGYSEWSNPAQRMVI